MKKTLLSMLLAAGLGLGSMGAGAATPDYQDWWWNPSQSGMGVNVGQRADTLVVAWYLFDSDSKGMYLMLSGQLKDNRLTGALYRSTGPVPGPGYYSGLVSTQAVGTATLEFSSVREGVLTYEYEGKSGSLPLQRYVFEGPADVSAGAMLGNVGKTGCADSAITLVPAEQNNVPIQVKTTEVRDGIYDLQFSFKRDNYNHWQCEAKSVALTLDKGVWRGVGNTTCTGILVGNAMVTLPPVTSNNGILSINALRMNGNNSFFDWSVDFSAAAKTACTVGGSFRGFAVTLDD